MGWAEQELTDGWELDGVGRVEVPGTAAAAVNASLWPGLDDAGWTWRTSFTAPAGQRSVLRLDGLATHCTVVLDGDALLLSESMWARHRLAVAPGRHDLELRFDPLGPEVARPRRPRARWRTRLVANGLRWHRTMLLGRAPGIAPVPAAVGPWRPVVLEHGTGARLTALRLRASLDGEEGVLGVEVSLDGPREGVEVRVGDQQAVLDADGRATLRLAGVDRWWPHTHGRPVLHEVVLALGDEVLARRRVGFRTLVDPRPGGGLALRVNGVDLFARGVVWTPVDPVGLRADPAELRRTLEAHAEAGMNLVRVVGTGAYEPAVFHELCDELGLLVWQDVMCANLDYPVADPAFRAVVEQELAQLVEDVAGHPSTAVLCGGSEVAQQVAMLGLDADELLRDGIGDTLLPAAVRAGGCDALVVPDAPSGGVRPFRSDAGVANYFGVGGYRRGLGDVRRAGVRFASECLAFANVGDHDPVDAGVPRDHGADWDFADVRDFYLGELHGVDPAALRSQDPEHHAALSRQVTGEVMAEVLAEWRRGASPCRGAIVLWGRDREAGSGWGLLDAGGRPKACWWAVRRALAPVAVWLVDEGLNGTEVHVSNDGPAPLRAELRLALHRDGGARPVQEARRELAVGPRDTVALDAEALLGRFVDIGYAYRFGPPQHDVVVASLEQDGRLLSQAFGFPAGRPAQVRSAAELGVVVTTESDGAERLRVRLQATALLYGVRLRAPGWRLEDDAFHVEPHAGRTLVLQRLDHGAEPAVEVTAANLRGVLRAG